MRNDDTGLFQTGRELCELLRRNRRWLGQKTRLFELQTAGRMNPPGSQRVICVCEANITALMVGEIQLIVPEPAVDPVRCPDHRWALDIQANAGVQVG